MNVYGWTVLRRYCSTETGSTAAAGAAAAAAVATGLMRLSKRLSRDGVCSRRQAEVMIRQGQVLVNGKVVRDPASSVSLSDSVQSKSKAVPKPSSASDDEPSTLDISKTALFVHNKKPGVVVGNPGPNDPADGIITHKSDEASKSKDPLIYLLPHLRRMGLPHLIPVGRLDVNTEGLLLLTNHGGLARALELPSSEIEREYRVKVHGFLDLDRLMRTAERGCKIEGIQYRPFQFRLEQKANTNAWVRMTLTEGKNREVRKILKAHGLDVVRLIRTRYGPYELDGVEKGAVMQVSPRKAFDLLRSKNIRVEDRRSGTLPPADK